MKKQISIKMMAMVSLIAFNIMTSVASASDTKTTELIKKKCITTEILEVCYSGNCTQAPCFNDLKCHQENENPNSATCLSSSTHLDRLSKDASILPPAIASSADSDAK